MVPCKDCRRATGEAEGGGRLGELFAWVDFVVVDLSGTSALAARMRASLAGSAGPMYLADDVVEFDGSVSSLSPAGPTLTLAGLSDLGGTFGSMRLKGDAVELDGR